MAAVIFSMAIRVLPSELIDGPGTSTTPAGVAGRSLNAGPHS